MHRAFTFSAFLLSLLALTVLVTYATAPQSIYLPQVASAPAPTFTPTPTLTPTPLPTETPTPEPTPTFLPPPTNTPTPDLPTIPSGDVANEQAVMDAINGQRNTNGSLAWLTLVPELTQSGRAHSRDMAVNGFTGHTGSSGSNFVLRMQEAGYQGVPCAEIIGWGFGGNAASMMNWWMNSAVHRSTILSTCTDEVGVGYIRHQSSQWGHYWTVNFGRRRAPGMQGDTPMYVCSYLIQGASGGSSLTVYSAEPCND
jgi:uncharacterized protein YkwD